MFAVPAFAGPAGFCPPPVSTDVADGPAREGVDAKNKVRVAKPNFAVGKLG